MAFAKVKRGRHSSSARVATFLSTLSRHKITLQHISGASNETGYVSRNPAVCCERYCQIWDFARKPAEVLIIIAVHVESQRCRMPFLSPAAWKRSQQDCPTFRRVCSQLKQGSTPSPKDTEHSGTYLSLSSIDRNKLLVVRNCSEHRTLVPQHMLSAFVTALRLRFSHPANTQLQKIFNRYFYSMGSRDVIRDITQVCAHCASLATLPPERPEYSTSVPPSAPGLRFASDVMRLERQFMKLTRDDFSAFTTTTILPKENKASFRLLETTAMLRSGS